MDLEIYTYRMVEGLSHGAADDVKVADILSEGTWTTLHVLFGRPQSADAWVSGVSDGEGVKQVSRFGMPEWLALDKQKSSILDLIVTIDGKGSLLVSVKVLITTQDGSSMILGVGSLGIVVIELRKVNLNFEVLPHVSIDDSQTLRDVKFAFSHLHLSPRSPLVESFLSLNPSIYEDFHMPS